MKDAKEVWRSRAAQLRRAIRDGFLEPATHQLVTYRDHWRTGHIPTPDEIRREVPNAPSYGTGIEDGALRGASFLAALCEEYELDRSAEVRSLAHTLFDGLHRAATAVEPAGFVPRWVLADGNSCYPESSADQHSLLLYGLWRFAGSPLATGAHRQACAQLAHRVTSRIRNHGWRIVRQDGRDAHAGGPLALTRRLGMLLAAHRLTGDTQWLAHYEDTAGDDPLALRDRLFALLGDGPATPSGWGFYGPEQHAQMLTIALAEEPAPERRAVYGRLRAEIARRFLRGHIPTSRHRPAYTPEARRNLGDATHISTPFAAPAAFRHELWGIDEDRGWRRDHCLWATRLPEADATAYVLWWMGRRPALCHERNCAISPLVAYRVALLSGDAGLIQAAEEPIGWYFSHVDLTRAGKLGSLTTAHEIALAMAQA